MMSGLWVQIYPNLTPGEPQWGPSLSGLCDLLCEARGPEPQSLWRLPSASHFPRTHPVSSSLPATFSILSPEQHSPAGFGTSRRDPAGISRPRTSCRPPATGHCLCPVLTLSPPQERLGSPRHPTSSWPPLDLFLEPCWEVQKSHPLLLQLDPELKGMGQEKMHPKSSL